MPSNIYSRSNHFRNDSWVYLLFVGKWGPKTQPCFNRFKAAHFIIFFVCVCVLKYFTHILTDLVIFLFIYLNIYLFINLFVNSATLQPKKHSEYEIL